MPGYRFAAWLRPLLTLAALAGVLSLAACGGGNGAPNNPFQGGAGPLAISPAVATLYSGNPFVFAVTGGNAPYAITSSDQAVLPAVGTLDGNTLVVTPGNVGADTSVTLTFATPRISRSRRRSPSSRRCCCRRRSPSRGTRTAAIQELTSARVRTAPRRCRC
jgi:hypothetical protein